MAKNPSKTKTIRKSDRTNKSALVLQLLGRINGASIEELIKATEWQAHSVRGFLSGVVRKRLGHAIERYHDDKGTTRYRIATKASRPEAAPIQRKGGKSTAGKTPAVPIKPAGGSKSGSKKTAVNPKPHSVVDKEAVAAGEASSAA